MFKAVPNQGNQEIKKIMVKTKSAKQQANMSALEGDGVIESVGGWPIK